MLMMKVRCTANNVFVYGTLRHGESNHHWLARARYQGSAQTKPQYTMFDMGGYPGIIPRGRTAINGEVYQVDDVALHQLDRLEEVPDYYIRETIETRFGRAWIYLLSDKVQAQMDTATRAHYAKVGHGNWIQYRKMHEHG